MLTVGLALVVVVVQAATATTTSAATPPRACELLTRAEVRRLLLDKSIVNVEFKQDKKNEATRCTWETRYYQTPKFKQLDARFSLQLDTQSTASAADALADLRRSAAGFSSSVDRIDDLGDEAYEHFADMIVVSGAVTFQVGLQNFDTSKKPHPDADQIARDAAQLVLQRLG
jgi:hypothetical protein